MTPAEAAAILTYASALDNRNVTPEAAQAWAETLDKRMRPDDARWIIRDHYAATRDWIMPADLNRRFRDVRAARIRAAGDDYRLPAGLDQANYDRARLTFREAIAAGQSKDDATGAAWRAIGHDPNQAEIGPPTAALAQLVADARTITDKENP